MMSPDVVAAVLVPAIALAISAVNARITAKRTKELTLNLPPDREETISVPVAATHADVAKAVEESVALEQRVYVALSAILHGAGKIQFGAGSGPDFIVDVAGRRLAIEVKRHLDHLRRDQVLKYSAGAPNAERLVVISPEPPPKALTDATKDLQSTNRLQFVQLAEDEAVADVLRNALAMPSAG